MDEVIDVAVIDDDEMLLGSISDLWFSRCDAGIHVSTKATTVTELLSAGEPGPTIVLLDLLLGDGSAIDENVRRLRRARRTVIAISVINHAGRIREAIRAGAHSYVHKAKDPDELVDAIRAALMNEPFTSRAHAATLVTGRDVVPLSQQEREAFRLYASGMTRNEVAERMNIKPNTVKDYLARGRRKYAGEGRPVPNKLLLRQRADEDGMLPTDGSTP